jgi:hypothetical protein
MKKIYFIVCVVVVFFTTSNSTAQTNVTSSGISIQGIARDVNNEALANIDQLDLNFQIYYFIGASTTPTNILTTIATIKTDNFGVFSYVVGVNQDQYNLISNQSAYLKVSSGSVVFSDEKLQTVPYAIYAQNGVPTGTIVAFIGTVAPTGWLICDGSAIPNTPYYANLKAMLGNATTTPALQAMFLRGAGAGNGKIGPAVMGAQMDALGSHNHGVNILTTTNGNHSHSIGRRSNSDNGAYDSGDLHKTENSASTTDRSNIGYFNTDPAGNHNHYVIGNTANTGDTETRPINWGVNWIIKI